MKKIVLVLAIALMGIAVNAQSPRHHNDNGHGNPEQMVERRVERLDKALQLTESQKAEIAKIYMLEMEAVKKEKQSMAPGDEKPGRPDESVMKARREEMKARRAATDAKIEALLTPEQATKYAEFKRHEGNRHHGRHHDGVRQAPRHDGCCCNQSTGQGK